MTREETRQVTQELTFLAECFERELSAAVLGKYVQELSSEPAAYVRRAIEKAHRECEWFPRIAKLLEFCAGFRAEEEMHAYFAAKDRATAEGRRLDWWEWRRTVPR